MSLKDDLSTLRTELEALRTEVTDLRKEMKTLRKFISIEVDEDTREPIGMNMRCGVIVLTHPDVPNHNQAYIGASANGPYMLMMDHRNKARVFFAVEKNEPKLVLRSAEVNDAVLLRVDPVSGRGLIAALDNGKPRAVMQAANDGSGAISAVHDDGKTRIAMRSEPPGGEILATNSAMKITVKIKAEGMRLDHYLAMYFQDFSRSELQKAIEGGHVRLNRIRVSKTGHAVKPGDILTLTLYSGVRVIRVLGEAERRGAATAAQALYEDLPP